MEGNKVMLWGALEDLAVKSGSDSEEFKYLVEMKGEQAVEERKKFLEME